MRGSQWEGAGRGRGIGLEWVLLGAGVVVVLAVLAVYYYGGGGAAPAAVGIETITTTGVGCGQSPLPQAALAVERDPRFSALTGVRCFDYMGETTSGGISVLTFDYYNGTIAYPCGTTAYDVVAGQIRANVTSGGAVASVSRLSRGLNPPQACPAPPPVSVVSVEDVSSLIPAVPELNVTMEASPGGQAVTSLRASLTLAGSAQQFVFVSQPAILAPGSEVSKTEIVSTSGPFSPSVLYPMSVTGTLADGQAFSFQASVQVAGIP